MVKIKTRTDMLELFPKNVVIAELGVFKGDFSQEILDICRPRTLYLVDIWKGSLSSADKDGENFIHFDDLEVPYLQLKEKYKLNDKVQLVRSTTELFLAGLPDSYLDAVYIDGDHSYHGVRKDLFLSYYKVKDGGFISGHDYMYKTFPEVVNAVDEFIRDMKFTLEYLTEDGYPSFLIRCNK